MSFRKEIFKLGSMPWRNFLGCTADPRLGIKVGRYLANRIEILSCVSNWAEHSFGERNIDNISSWHH